MKKHMETVHERKKPHSCYICNKAFSHKGNLNVHIGTHQLEIQPVIEITEESVEEASVDKVEETNDM